MSTYVVSYDREVEMSIHVVFCMIEGSKTMLGTNTATSVALSHWMVVGEYGQ